MGVVVLHPDAPQRSLLLGKAGAEIIRVQIMGHHPGIDVQDAFQVAHGFLKESVGREVFHIPDVLADKGLIAAGEANRVLQLGAAGQNGRCRVFQENRHRYESP